MSGRVQTRGEELANSISHGIATALAIAGSVFLLLHAVRDGGAARITAAAIYSASLILLYLASTLYHAVPAGRAKRILRLMDHNAIFLLIAGTYTPFTLGVLRGAWGWSLFGVVWGLALAGILFKSFGGMRFAKLSLVIYLAMGWLVVVAVRPMWLRMEPAGLAWLLAGGLVYSLGVAFYAAKRMPFGHLVWHLLIVLATVFHYVAVFRYAS